MSFLVAYRYTNFSINVFTISTAENSKLSDKHTVKIYRFWSYDTVNNPSETAIFLKFINTINKYNPGGQKKLDRKRKGKKETKKDDDNKKMSNYLIHSK